MYLSSNILFKIKLIYYMTMHEIAFILYCYKYKNFNYLNNLEHILCIELCMADTYIISYQVSNLYKPSN